MIDPQSIAIRLVAAAVLGGAVGMERERVESAAGLRTHALVSTGAALLMIVSMFGFGDAVNAPSVVLDPSRVAAQIVSGIGFLGAGVIIFRREIIRGLTTAASVWMVAAIGMAVGGGLLLAAGIATVLALGILAVMKPLERRLAIRRRPLTIRVTIDPKRIEPRDVLALLEQGGLLAKQVDARYADEPQKTRLDVVVNKAATPTVLAALHALAASDGVREVRSSLALSPFSERRPAQEP